MTQEINQSGVINKLTERNVIFSRREIKNILIIEGQKIIIDYKFISEEGEKNQSVEIPFLDFGETKSIFWKLLNKYIVKEEVK